MDVRPYYFGDHHDMRHVILRRIANDMNRVSPRLDGSNGRKQLNPSGNDAQIGAAEMFTRAVVDRTRCLGCKGVVHVIGHPYR